VSDPFLQSDGQTLKNRLGIFQDPETLRFQEREYSRIRAETVHDEVTGNFDAAHLRAIHGHIFQDVYEWAGTMRSETILLEDEQINVPAAIGALAKGSTVFMASAYVERGLAHVAALANSEAGRSADPAVFADAATEVLDALNHVHPFREGNGRTQRAFMEQLAERAGHSLNFKGVTGERMILASIEAEAGDTSGLRDILKESLDPARVALRLDAVADVVRSGQWADAALIPGAASPWDSAATVVLGHPAAEVGAPNWSATTVSFSRSAARRNMVFAKLPPCAP
jgi:cell filamentation protein